MELREPIDKSSWPDGPWKTEPDRTDWTCHGFPCIVLRVAQHGALCGYVGVPPGHPWHGQHYDAIEAEVHGGLTYAKECAGAVCHVPAPGEPEDLWWLGFDHAHAFDLCPAPNHDMTQFGDGHGEEYRSLEYAVAGTEDLARQAAEATKREPVA